MKVRGVEINNEFCAEFEKCGWDLIGNSVEIDLIYDMINYFWL